MNGSWGVWKNLPGNYNRRRGPVPTVGDEDEIVNSVINVIGIDHDVIWTGGQGHHDLFEERAAEIDNAYLSLLCNG